MAVDLLQDHGGKLATAIGAVALFVIRVLVGREYKRISTAVERIEGIDGKYVSREELQKVINSIRDESRQNLGVIEDRFDQLNDRIEGLWKHLAK